ncbi:Ktr system potassium uptake protein B [Halomicronema hongdechloris C2206]|uniref:Ktr system potassium uptake protein B n=1 Tax=Halomicronema hongdechloris C2206 TaxID=1641165 RepID=A0A1Z3HK68_9CYAN|nr:TrkH family potassium uptake protein [Halomicronema hongdechloris]ASC70712.1 Ktr system potassium uptake protein B [Halomicronema hongdechloris C2206]
MTVSRTICLGFLALITAGTLLLLLPIATADGQWNSPLIALFTATSAVCVTGLIIVDTGSYFSPSGQAIILLLIQVGGLGYMTATTFLLLLLGRKLGLRDRLALQQSMDQSELAGGRRLVLSIILMTLILELTGVFLLMPLFSPDFDAAHSLWLAVFHSISAFNNAGFSLFADSLIGYAQSPWMTLVISALIILGGIGYQVIMEAMLWLRDRIQRRRSLRIFSLHFKIVTSTTIILLGLGTIALLSTEFNNPATLGLANLPDKLIMAWFQSVTTRTAGFNSIDIGQMENTSLFIIIALMFVGASPGSTGGGIKTTTLRILLACTRTVLQGKEEVLCFQRQIPSSRVLKAIGVVMGSGLTVIGTTTLISITDPEFNFIAILFESVSAFATVGLSAGITADLTIWAQLAIIATMYVGRVGVLLFMATILGDSSPSVIHYPEEDLLVG